ncbi:unnamed protein product [Didymodactylos carnosus]|nr:unnamed protein product [Didymodactylos carnosus]CAF4124739.1 unnamed protein product [Didymodactylos carnosus]
MKTSTSSTATTTLQTNTPATMRSQSSSQTASPNHSRKNDSILLSLATRVPNQHSILYDNTQQDFFVVAKGNINDLSPNRKTNERVKEELETSPFTQTSNSQHVYQRKRRKIEITKKDDNNVSSDEDEIKHLFRVKKKRPETRRIIEDDELCPQTQLALTAEREREKRLQEKQKLYNETLLNEQQKLNAENAGEQQELILEQYPLIEVDRRLVKQMKKHQIEGVRFLWDNCYESVERLKQQRHISQTTIYEQNDTNDIGGSGCIMAHCMGLGKTFQVISFIHTLFNNQEITGLRTVLVLCPLNTVFNWEAEFEKWWLSKLEPKIKIYQFATVEKAQRIRFLRSWHSYEMYRLLTINDDEKARKKYPDGKEPRKLSLEENEAIEKHRFYLRNPGPDLIVCDEAHILKNLEAGITVVVNKILTKRRICLTGTPMQNNLLEYYAMVNFCKPNGLLGTKEEFKNRFQNPIEAGQHRDSSPSAVKKMKLRSYLLNDLLKNCIHRRDFNVLRKFLPKKSEYTIKIRCSPLQKDLYAGYLGFREDEDVGKPKLILLNNGKFIKPRLLPDYHYLMKIWTHPWLLRAHFVDHFHKIKNDVDDSQEEINQLFNHEDDVQDISNDDKDERPKKQSKKKTVVLKSILDQCNEIGDKVLLFSRSLFTLSYIEELLELWSTKTIKWQKGVDYFRMDGKTEIEKRTSDVKIFNQDKSARLFLISTTAGGIGINLFGANRVIIFDCSWNPAHDLQAMFRSYRLGQSKPVFVYRLLVNGTMEEVIYRRQITKTALSHRVVDAEQLDRHFTTTELQEIYSFTPDEGDTLSTMNEDRIKDEILKTTIHEHKQFILSCQEHDSLLEDRLEEKLTEEEKQQALDEDISTEIAAPTTRRYHRYNSMPGQGTWQKETNTYSDDDNNYVDSDDWGHPVSPEGDSDSSETTSATNNILNISNIAN